MKNVAANLGLHILLYDADIVSFVYISRNVFAEPYDIFSIFIRNLCTVHCVSAGKETTCNAGDLGSTPGLGKYPGEGKGHPLQNSPLEDSMDYLAHGTQSWTGLSDFHFPQNSCTIYIPTRSEQRFQLPTSWP